MKQKTPIIILFIALLACLFFIYKLWNEKAAVLKKYSLFTSLPDSCKFDSSNYRLVHMSKDSCDYIVIKKKGPNFSFFKNNKSFSLKAFDIYSDIIDTAVAIKMITKYNEDHNTDLSNSSVIKFEYDAVTQYLVDAKVERDSLKFFKVYLGKYDNTTARTPEGYNKNSVILSVADPKKEFFLGENKTQVINYGGLCPPPQSVQELKDSGVILLATAIERSTDLTMRRSGGIESSTKKTTKGKN